MESRVVTFYDYHLVDLTEFHRTFVADQARIAEELSRLKKHHAAWQNADVVSKGDVAIVRSASENVRFQRENLKLSVGSGLFDKELENALIGMNVGEERELFLSDGTGVSVRVLSVLHRDMREPDDAMIRELGMEGVDTLEDYVKYLTGKQKEEFYRDDIYQATRKVMEQVITKSDMVFKKADWDAVVAARLQNLKVLAELEGFALETATPEQFEGRIPVKSYQELLVLLQNEAWDMLSRYLLGYSLAEKDGYLPCQEEYETYLQNYMAAWHQTEEESRRICPYEFWVFMEYGNYFRDKMTEYVTKSLLEEED